MLKSHDEVKHSCFNCANSFVDDNDNLICVFSGEKVSDDSGEDCEGWN